jgi:hypothetical protein
MDESKEDGQAGCTEKPYWSAAKKVCGVDQYGAPSMDGSKYGQAGVPAAVPTGTPATVAVAQGPAVPAVVPVGVSMAAAASKGLAATAAGPMGALAPAARKREPTGGWPATMPIAVPAGAPTAATAAKEPTAPTAGVGARGGGACGVTSGCDGTHGALTGGGGSSLKGGDGRGEVGQSNTDGDGSDGDDVKVGG